MALLQASQLFFRVVALVGLCHLRGSFKPMAYYIIRPRLHLSLFTLSYRRPPRGTLLTALPRCGLQTLPANYQHIFLMETTSASSTLSNALPLADGPRPRMVERLFLRALGNLQQGCLRIHFPSGACSQIGNPSYAPIEMRIGQAGFFRKVYSGGSVALGEAHVDGLWTTANLSGLLTLLAKNQKELGRVQYGFSVLAKKMNQLYHRARRNTVEQSRENI